MNIEKYKTNIYSCIRCSYCRDTFRYRDNSLDICPSREVSAGGFECYTGKGKLMLARGVLEGTIPLSPELAKIVASCPTCRNCWDKCYANGFIDHVPIYEALRADLWNAGYAPEQHKKLVAGIEKYRNPYNELHEKRFNWLEKFPVSEQAELVYFTGCTSAYRQQNIARATASILGKAGVNFKVMGSEEWCCGSPAARVGAVDVAKSLAEHNVEAIKRMGAKRVIFSCAGCYRAFKVDYPQIIGKLDFEVLHSSEFISKLLDEGKITGLKALNKTVTYHDPCHIGRHLMHLEAQLFDQPRKVLKSIPGLKLTEMVRIKRNARCCGAGGGFKSAFNDLAVKVASNRVQEAEKTQAEILASTCPFCYRNLSDGVKAANSKLQVYDLSELVDMAL
jgi:heterodisulfide reductase subunit D